MDGILLMQEDLDRDSNNRTVNVTEENAELIALGILQSTFWASLSKMKIPPGSRWR